MWIYRYVLDMCQYYIDMEYQVLKDIKKINLKQTKIYYNNCKNIIYSKDIAKIIII